ncbi:MAG: multicopper oxidase domain-containing protein [Cyclobacteriaceae bacterium]|nr:multicopper oxidase domain-containing protein [Cyclobacteriaceae bacterium]
MKLFYCLFFYNFRFTVLFAQKTVRYDLYVKDTIVIFSGKVKRAMAVNGQIPIPTLTFTEGDTAIIRVHNKLIKDETSIQWHGLLLPNEEDGSMRIPDIYENQTNKKAFG